MGSMFKSKVAIGVAGIAVLAGAGGTYAATHRSNNNERQAFLADAAKRLNVSPKELNDALQGAFSDRLDAAVSAGRLTRTQADEIKQHLQADGGLPDRREAERDLPRGARLLAAAATDVVEPGASTPPRHTRHRARAPVLASSTLLAPGAAGAGVNVK